MISITAATANAAINTVSTFDTISASNRVTIMAQVPLAELFGYTTDLRGSTSGTASFTMEPSHYAEVKEELADLPAKKK